LFVFSLGCSCAEKTPPKPWKFREGDVVYFVISGEKGQVINLYGNHQYFIRFKESDYRKDDFKTKIFYEYELMKDDPNAVGIQD